MNKEINPMKIPVEERLQFITNQWSETSIPQQVENVCKGGCRWIQLRLKETDASTWAETGADVKAICRDFGAKLIVNDHVEFAFRVDTDGVHVGKEDMAPEKARQLLGEGKIIGGTANSAEEIMALYRKGVNYVGLGPFRHTTTKQKLSPTLGLEGFHNIMDVLNSHGITLPVFAIGGIEPEDIEELVATGIHGVVISSSLANSNDIEKSTRQLINKLKQTNQHVDHRR
ncbi:MAG: thiamine phosphate synthase [Bacteroidota bacterium]